jgi:hypothetical protein
MTTFALILALWFALSLLPAILMGKCIAHGKGDTE